MNEINETGDFEDEPLVVDNELQGEETGKFVNI
jgi:hypothetical protein